ncbi:sirohydrochlorin chelatase [Natribacillus halophilus]|uniref:Sirohydrochlorin cobaltochelatase n=1 Tax=Natribacillus halophilus TaxID=549003 RepID=A0A1G8MXE5_9BACI|nr:sirohydrochlorin chelatase [Natribacillus halophilus]SDI72719.1 sirohydrochlorin cobaltochelatase [Natribacillus halophilus]
MVQRIMNASKTMLEDTLHEHGFTHLNVRTHGSHLVIYSEEDMVKVNRARLTRFNLQTYELSICNHRGEWEATPFSGTMAEMLTLIIEKFPHTLSRTLQAILYVGHGSRVKEGNEQFETFIDYVKNNYETEMIQEIAYIELVSPTITEGIKACIEQGATKIAVVPVLLLSASHANVDIPRELERAKETYPHVKISCGRPFGIEDDVIDVAVSRLLHAGLPALGDDREREDCTVLVVGRGSSDGKQPSDVAKIARLIYERVACNNVETCFLAATTPTVEQGLAKVEKLEAPQVYVLPYLLFTGVLMEELDEMLREREGKANTRYTLCDFLGSDDGLSDVLARRTEEALNEEGRVYT